MALFLPITKVDVAQRLVYGTLSEEIPDKTGEILDYQSAKPAFEQWSAQMQAATGGKSFGNVRAMHGAVAAGKLTAVAYDDAHKRIEGVAKIVDDDAWRKVEEGVYTGFSIGGGYARRWPDPGNPELMRYTPTLSEVSLVDNPALPTATFNVIKRDGSIECRKFLSPNEVPMTPDTLNTADATAQAEPALPEILDLLDDLAWLEEVARQNSDYEIIACVATLQEYLREEYGVAEAGGASSAGYAAELAQSGAQSAPAQDDTQKYARARIANAALAKQLAQTASLVDTLHTRIARLEAQPLPAKGAVRAVAKADDYGTAQEALRALTPAERAHELMKLAMANPLSV
jgi:hypothetical protein